MSRPTIICWHELCIAQCILFSGMILADAIAVPSGRGGGRRVRDQWGCPFMCRLPHNIYAYLDLKRYYGNQSFLWSNLMVLYNILVIRSNSLLSVRSSIQ